VESRNARNLQHPSSHPAEDDGELELGVEQIRARRTEIPHYTGEGARVAETLDRDHVDRDSELPDLVRNGVPVSLLQHGHARLGTATIEMLQIGKEHPLRAAHAE
jgi:hypothetical protein